LRGQDVGFEGGGQLVEQNNQNSVSERALINVLHHPISESEVQYILAVTFY